VTLSLGLKRSRREADDSPPSNSEVKNVWGYTTIPQCAFMAWCSIKKSTGTALWCTYSKYLCNLMVWQTLASYSNKGHRTSALSVQYLFAQMSKFTEFRHKKLSEYSARA